MSPTAETEQRCQAVGEVRWCHGGEASQRARKQEKTPKKTGWAVGLEGPTALEAEERAEAGWQDARRVSTLGGGGKEKSTDNWRREGEWDLGAAEEAWNNEQRAGKVEGLL